LAILSLGLVFYLNQQVVGSIAAATGAVFQTAWRHALLALTVLIGALVGQAWGLAGVAVGVLGALTINYLLMSQLALRLTGLTWRDVLRAHGSALLLTLVVAGSALAARWIASRLGLPPAAVLLACAATTATAALLSVRIWPRRLLGPEGTWWLERVARAVPRRYGRTLERLIGVPSPP
jgi:hypothetical protein